MRRTSVSLPTKQVARDPHEKPDRYQPARRGHDFFSTMKEAWVHQSQRTRWLRTAAVAFTVLLFFWWLSPRGVQVYNGVSRVQGNKGQMPSDSTYGTDRCQKSYSKDKPIVQYALMVDAGSTGSRIHVYKFNNCGPIPELEKEEFKMTDKSVGGLSKYKDDPVAAAKTLDPLLQHAMEHVPDSLKRCTPIAVKATAGLRLAGPEKSQAILDEVRRHLETDYPFPVVSAEQEGVAVMDGSLEGVYAWVTANYLLGKIGGPDKGETAAVFDLGGGSTQIVFEPTFKGASGGGMPEKLAEGDHKYSLDFGGQKFDLYQHSHLGYGLMSARKAIHQMLVSDIAAKESGKAWMAKPVVHPCIAPGMSQEIEVEMDEDTKLFNFTGPSQPAPAQCRHLAEKILKKSADCKLAPCSFNGVHQPSLGKTFAKEDVYIFSYFYDRVKPLGMPDSFTVREMHDLTQTVCMGKNGWDVFTSMPEAMEELDGRPEYCLDLNFMMALLHTGYDMPIDREVKIAKKIKGNELGWCLGASLPLLSPSSGWKCKVQQVI
ncbi:GDA1/CD39 (nucleoside phosphatase) family protein [Hirsutella rhossiliensis]|uniref:guanosine-diphosphatase n=1 Tax=Hirsutella rhossiliensis TaxID=111463 RepID=A0A9P8N1R2_9HYPO|nr:GDA1/CD39 (nucleoside phosphatase) family domain-containing protein [Hirsutella rhossiliensis]KAH0965280.1 GDA1/CD39 (nucleoside phosphatase) family domain-containing protein [Hirsutella rhossiliensis]